MIGSWLVLLPLASAADVQGAAWLGVEGELDVGDRVELGLSEELRGEVYPQGPSELLTDVKARVGLVDGVALQGSYRLVVPLPTRAVGHRLALDLRLRRRLEVVGLKLRQRYTVAFAGQTRHTLRTRLGAELRFDHVRPYVSVEPFLRVDDAVRFHKVRLTVGAKVPFPAVDLVAFSHVEHQRDGDWLVVGGSMVVVKARVGD